MSTPTICAALERLLTVCDTDESNLLNIDPDRLLCAIADARAALAAEPVEGELEPTHVEISQWINANPVLRPGSTGGPMIRIGTDWLAVFADAAKWGAQFRPATTAAPEVGEVGELAAWLRTYASEEFGPSSDHPDAAQLTRAATLLEQRAAPSPAAPRPEGDWFAVATIAQDMRSRGLAEQACGDELLKLANNNRSQPVPPAAPAAPMPTHDLSNAAPLLWLLWNHLGSQSPVGQPIRDYLGMGQFESMSAAQIEAASFYQALGAETGSESSLSGFGDGEMPLG